MFEPGYDPLAQLLASLADLEECVRLSRDPTQAFGRVKDWRKRLGPLAPDVASRHNTAVTQASALLHYHRTLANIRPYYDAIEHTEEGSWQRVLKLADYIVVLSKLQESCEIEFCRQIAQSIGLPYNEAVARIINGVTEILESALATARMGNMTAFYICRRALKNLRRGKLGRLQLPIQTPDDWADLVLQHMGNPPFKEFRRPRLDRLDFLLQATEATNPADLNSVEAMVLLAQWRDDAETLMVPGELLYRLAQVAVGQL